MRRTLIIALFAAALGAASCAQYDDYGRSPATFPGGARS